MHQLQKGTIEQAHVRDPRTKVRKEHVQHCQRPDMDFRISLDLQTVSIVS